MARDMFRILRSWKRERRARYQISIITRNSIANLNATPSWADLPVEIINQILEELRNIDFQSLLQLRLVSHELKDLATSVRYRKWKLKAWNDNPPPRLGNLWGLIKHKIKDHKLQVIEDVKQHTRHIVVAREADWELIDKYFNGLPDLTSIEWKCDFVPWLTSGGVIRKKYYPPLTQPLDHNHDDLRSFIFESPPSVYGYMGDMYYPASLTSMKDNQSFLPSLNKLESLVLKNFIWHETFSPPLTVLCERFDVSNLRIVRIESPVLYGSVKTLGNCPGTFDRLKVMEIRELMPRGARGKPKPMMDFLPKLLRRLTSVERLKLCIAFGAGGLHLICHMLDQSRGTLRFLSLRDSTSVNRMGPCPTWTAETLQQLVDIVPDMIGFEMEINAALYDLYELLRVITRFQRMKKLKIHLSRKKNSDVSGPYQAPTIAGGDMDLQEANQVVEFLISTGEEQSLEKVTIVIESPGASIPIGTAMEFRDDTATESPGRYFVWKRNNLSERGRKMRELPWIDK